MVLYDSYVVSASPVSATARFGQFAQPASQARVSSQTTVSFRLSVMRVTSRSDWSTSRIHARWHGAQRCVMGRTSVGRSLIVGRWSVVVGRWALVVGRLSLVDWRWSLVGRRWSLV